jgi:hypothetical protein
MRTADYSNFYKLMAEVHRKRRQQLEDENSKLWEGILGLLSAIADSELDGSGFYEVKEHADKFKAELLSILEAKQ